jgi:hypothetical protein
MPKPDGADGQALEFVYKLTEEGERTILGNGKQPMDWRRYARRHRIVKKSRTWVHVECDPYPDDGSVPPVEPDQKRRTFILLRSELENCGGAYCRGDDSESYHLTVRDAIISFRVFNWQVFDRMERDRFLEEHNRNLEEIDRMVERLTRGTVPAYSCFAALGVERNASKEEGKAAYRKKARELHPDKGGDQVAFIELQKNYETALRLEKARSFGRPPRPTKNASTE